MTTIAALLFTGTFAASIAIIALALSGAMPRIMQIIRQVHGAKQEKLVRKITVSLPVEPTAKILPMVKKTRTGVLAIHPDRIAA